MTEHTNEDSQKWLCDGCGKVVSTHPATNCQDCGAPFRKPTGPEELACDGCGAPDGKRVLGHTRLRICDDCLNVDDAWFEQACENIQQWGVQEVETLLLAIQEELGELTQSHLEATHEDGDRDRIEAELQDLGALCYQLQWALNDAENGGASA